MEFLKNLLRNIIILVAIGVFLYFASPDIMGQVYNLFGSLFGPLAIIMLVVLALPRRSRR